MQETSFCFHNLEWPGCGAVLSGPVLWLRGWAVGKPGTDLIDVRVCHAGAIHRGILGLPRTDLAAHFGSAHPWLPAEFIVGLPVTDGIATITIELMDAHGGWHPLTPVNFTIAAGGQPPPRVEGRLETSPDGTWTVRDAHHPFHGHLDQPGPNPGRFSGRIPVFGWLLDESAPLHAVVATTDTLVFNHLDHSLKDETLARKFPQHQGALHSRLKGLIDYPAGLVEPACLRVYTLAADGSANLCFAQRITARRPVDAPATTHVSSATPLITERTLPALPSGRPRRLLMFVRTLMPADATLRALELAAHLAHSHRWAVRLISTEDGPLRHRFSAADAGSLIVDPSAYFSAADPRDAEQQLQRLGRLIRWDHLDAVAIFDPLCGWALHLAHARGIPTLFDCSETILLQADPTAIPAVQEQMKAAWTSAAAICFNSQTAAFAQSPFLANRPSAIIPDWHSEMLIPAEVGNDTRRAMAPLRAVRELRRHHPSVAARWKFVQGPAMSDAQDKLLRQDEAWHCPALAAAPDWNLAGIDLFLGPLFARGPLKPVLNAVASGIPTVTVRTALTMEIFGRTRLPLVEEGNALALSHALLAFEAIPEQLRRQTADAMRVIRAAHDPKKLIPQWEKLLATVAAARG
jgi:hypothetical protein